MCGKNHIETLFFGQPKGVSWPFIRFHLLIQSIQSMFVLFAFGNFLHSKDIEEKAGHRPKRGT
jgi:hypothetical protein